MPSTTVVTLHVLHACAPPGDDAGESSVSVRHTERGIKYFAPRCCRCYWWLQRRPARSFFLTLTHEVDGNMSCCYSVSGVIDAEAAAARTLRSVALLHHNTVTTFSTPACCSSTPRPTVEEPERNGHPSTRDSSGRVQRTLHHGSHHFLLFDYN